MGQHLVINKENYIYIISENNDKVTNSQKCLSSKWQLVRLWWPI